MKKLLLLLLLSAGTTQSCFRDCFKRLQKKISSVSRKSISSDIDSQSSENCAVWTSFERIQELRFGQNLLECFVQEAADRKKKIRRIRKSKPATLRKIRKKKKQLCKKHYS